MLKYKMSKMKPVMMIVLTCALVLMNLHVLAAAKSDRVLLEDIKVLTLHQGQMTNARRSSPVPQLKCVGGSAGCHAFKPQVVQCYNRGSDGYDVQWECKTDMDNSYRFGRLQVSCEGYDYPDDPYILRGSCGLEYNLDLTEEGHQRKNNAGYQQGGYQSNYHGNDYHYRGDYSGYGQKASSVLSDLFKLAVVALLVYMLYRCCIAGPRGTGGDQPPSYEDTFRGQQHHQGSNPSAPPPPYGFRQDYMPGQGDSCSSGAGYSSSQNYTSPPPGGNTGGGFWSGAFTGGILGYLMGNRNNGYYGYQRPHTWGWGRNNWGTGWGNSFGTGWGSSWGGGARTSYSSSHRSGGGFSSSGSRSSSSGTRTTSGFGGTTRR